MVLSCLNFMSLAAKSLQIFTISLHRFACSCSDSAKSTSFDGKYASHFNERSNESTVSNPWKEKWGVKPVTLLGELFMHNFKSSKLSYGSRSGFFNVKKDNKVLQSLTRPSTKPVEVGDALRSCVQLIPSILAIWDMTRLMKADPRSLTMPNIGKPYVRNSLLRQVNVSWASVVSVANAK